MLNNANMIKISKMRKDAGRDLLNCSIARMLKSELETLSEETGLGVSKLVELAVYDLLEKQGKL